MNLDKEQLDFLNKELNITREEIVKMSFDEWDTIRERCFEIETEEFLNMEKEGKDIDDVEEWTERCDIAVSIVDTSFAELNVP